MLERQSDPEANPGNQTALDTGNKLCLQQRLMAECRLIHCIYRKLELT